MAESPELDTTEAFRVLATHRFQQMVEQAAAQRRRPVERAANWHAGARWVEPTNRPDDFIEGTFRSRPKGSRLRVLREPRWWPVVVAPLILAALAGCSVVASGGPGPLPTLVPLQSAASSSSSAQPSASLAANAYLVALGDVDASVAATGQIAAAKQAQVSFSQPSSVVKIDIALGDRVKSGQTLVELAPVASQSQDSLSANLAKAQMQLAVDDAKIRQAQAGPSAADVGKARLALAQAQAKLDGDQTALAKLQAGPDPNAVAAALAVLQQQQAKLDALKAGPRPEQRQILQTQVDAAKNALYSAQASRDGACNKANPDYMCSAANASVNQAQTSLDAANKQYQLAVAAPTTQDLQQAQQAVAEAQAKYDAARSGPSAGDITQAQSQVKADQIAVQLAQADLDHPSTTGDDVGVLQAQRAVDELTVQQAQAAMTAQQGNSGGNPAAASGQALVAPFDGIVTAINVHVGDVGQTGSPAISVADPSSDQIVAAVNDTDIGRVAVGQKADVTLVRNPDDTTTGQISGITHVPVAQSGTAQYPVTVDVAKQLDSWADIGAGVRVRIAVSSQKNVVVVPNQYIKRDSNGRTTVQKLVDGKPTDTVVSTGLVGASLTQIVQGLQPGDRIVQSTAAFPPAPASSSSAS